MSTSPPWMPFNVGDYLRDTGHLTVAEHGAYMLLIMRYWQDGGLPGDEGMIRRYSLLSAEQWIESRPVLAALFDEGWKHKRIDTELAKAAEIIGKRKASAERMHSNRRASAEQVHSESSDMRVPPSPEPLPESPPPSVSVAAEGARDFEELFGIFPRNPTSSRAKAEAAFSATKAEDQPSIIAAARRFALWFAEDCATRKRTVDAGLKFAPHLATWLESGGWREAAALPVKSDPSAPVLPMVKLNRMNEPEVWEACERLQGKRAATSDATWSFPLDIVVRARAEVRSPASVEVH